LLCSSFYGSRAARALRAFPTRRSSDLPRCGCAGRYCQRLSMPTPAKTPQRPAASKVSLSMCHRRRPGVLTVCLMPLTRAEATVEFLHSRMKQRTTMCASRPPHQVAPWLRRVRCSGPLPDDEQEKQWYQQIVDQTVDSSLMKRYGTLDEQTAPICFLASREASYITGSVLPVSGGDQG